MAKPSKSGKDVVRKYGHFSVAVLVYYTPVHPLAIQGHCICKNSIRRVVNEEGNNPQLPLSSRTITPPMPPSLRKSSTHALDAALIDSPLNFTRRAIVEHVANRMKYYAVKCSVVNVKRPKWKGLHHRHLSRTPRSRALDVGSEVC